MAMFWTSNTRSKMQIQLRTSIVWNIGLCKCAFLIEEIFSFEMFTGVPKHRPKLISIHVFFGKSKFLPIQVFENRKFPFGQKRFVTYMVSQENVKKPTKVDIFRPQMDMCFWIYSFKDAWKFMFAENARKHNRVQWLCVNGPKPS